MSRFFPRDVLLVARLIAVAGALAWILFGGQAILSIAYLALGFLVLTAVLIWRFDVSRAGVPIPLSETPAIVVVGDLSAASVWMIASAANERSVAFVVVIAIGALAMYRIGQHGVTATAVAYLVGRIGQEIIRVGLGTPTPVPQIIGETMVVILVLIILSATVTHYRAEQNSGARALRLARSLQRVATEIGQETTPEGLFRSIARNALLLVDAHHATINRRRGDEFTIVAGAGTGERAVGVRASARLGIVGAVLRSRRAVAMDDYVADPTAIPAIKEIGVRSIVGVPIVVQGEIAATLTIARLQVRPFDDNDVRALEGLASHAAIALQRAHHRAGASHRERVARARRRDRRDLGRDPTHRRGDARGLRQRVRPGHRAARRDRRGPGGRRARRSPDCATGGRPARASGDPAPRGREHARLLDRDARRGERAGRFPARGGHPRRHGGAGDARRRGRGQRGHRHDGSGPHLRRYRPAGPLRLRAARRGRPAVRTRPRRARATHPPPVRAQHPRLAARGRPRAVRYRAPRVRGRRHARRTRLLLCGALRRRQERVRLRPSGGGLRDVGRRTLPTGHRPDQPGRDHR